MAQKKLSFIDLFAGAGGLSEGFLRKGYAPAAHVEMINDACLTLKTRLAYYYLKQNNKIGIYYSYLRGKITREEFYEHIPEEITGSVLNYVMDVKNLKKIFKEVRVSMKNFNIDKVDVLVGGPPCQTFSVAGRSVYKEKKLHDLRFYLYKLYGKFLKEFQPNLFIFENVPGLLSANGGEYYKNIKKYFRRIGYILEGKILDASDFGVVQTRKRLFLIGWKKNINIQYPRIKKVRNTWTVDDILGDLPGLDIKETDVRQEIRQICKYSGKSNAYLKKFAVRNGMDFVTQHVARPHNEKDRWIYGLAIDFLNEGRRIRNSDIPKNRRTQKNVHSFVDRFKVVDPNKLSHTMLAHIAKDGHYYIHPDKEQLRSLSVREAARIQSFPDDYFFEGTRSTIFRQIGNAVPPLMAERIAQKIGKLLIK